VALAEGRSLLRSEIDVDSFGREQNMSNTTGEQAPQNRTTADVVPTRLVRGSLRATGPVASWRTVDIVTTAFLGAALGIAFWGWGLYYDGPITGLKIAYAPLMGLFAGPWFLAGVVGGLVVRRPGAALFCEVVAGLVSMLPGTSWGATVLVSAILQGLGAELAFAAFGYRRFGVVAAAFAGMLAAPLEWLYETFKVPAGGGWAAEWPLNDKVAYLVCMGVSGVLLAGVLGWVLVRALAGAGALNAFPVGQERLERRAV
jgi:energy-coupling factor transport system substrate-specific component